MNLKTALKLNGYTMNDLWDRLRTNHGYRSHRTEIMKCGTATKPGKSPWWNDILSCLDEMGVDW